MRNFARFARLEPADRKLLVQAVFWLAVARVKLAAIPFRRLAEQLSAADDVALDTPPDPEMLRRVGRAVAIAAHHVPWRSDCFPQTIAARKLLANRGYASTIHLGVAIDDREGFAAHAWLTGGGIVITGAADLHRYSELHRFPPEQDLR